MPSSTEDEWEAWCYKNAPGQFLAYPLFLKPGKYSLLLQILLLLLPL